MFLGFLMFGIQIATVLFNFQQISFTFLWFMGQSFNTRTNLQTHPMHREMFQQLEYALRNLEHLCPKISISELFS